jgi:hypothetical protein
VARPIQTAVCKYVYTECIHAVLPGLHKVSVDVFPETCLAHWAAPGIAKRFSGHAILQYSGCTTLIKTDMGHGTWGIGAERWCLVPVACLVLGAWSSRECNDVRTSRAPNRRHVPCPPGKYNRNSTVLAVCMQIPSATVAPASLP